jgi:uncharacterized protein YecE (DUF72 family)
VVGTRVKIGCCGFRVGMARYFETLETVELNSTFYRYPSPELVERWRRAAPDTFEFTVKAHQDISHRLGLQPSKECTAAFERMRQICAILRSKVMLIQTPASFQPTKENLVRAGDFFQKVDRGDLALAWETRGDTWNTPRTRERLRSLLSEVEVTHTTDPFLVEPAYSTPKLAYLRLHGLGERMYYYQFTDRELEQAQAKAAQIGVNSERTYLLFNNLTMFEDARRLAQYLKTGRFEPLSKAIGWDSVRETIGRTRYPISKSSLLKYFGWRLVEVRRGEQVRLSQLLSRLSKRSYGSSDEITEELSRTWDQTRVSKDGCLVSSRN